MNSSVLTVAIGLISAAASVWSLVQLRDWHRGIPKLRSTALEEFRKTVLRSDVEEMQFDGAPAEIVMQEEVGGPGGALSKHPPYTLTVYARNRCGQYFMYVYTPPHTFVKHVRDEIARIVLEDRYIAPMANLPFQQTAPRPLN